MSALPQRKGGEGLRSTLLERFVIEFWSRAERLPLKRMPKILWLVSIPLFILLGILGAILYGFAPRAH